MSLGHGRWDKLWTESVVAEDAPPTRHTRANVYREVANRSFVAYRPENGSARLRLRPSTALQKKMTDRLPFRPISQVAWVQYRTMRTTRRGTAGKWVSSGALVGSDSVPLFARLVQEERSQ